MKKYKIVIFDLDGTLLNTSQDICDCMNSVLLEYSYPQITEEQAKIFVGNGIKKLVELSIPNGDMDPKYDEICGKFIAYYAENCTKSTVPYDKIIDSIEQLRGAGAKLAIVSNKDQNALNFLVETYFSGYFSLVFGNTNTVPKKPLPILALQVIEELGGDLESAVFVGDTEVDFSIAKRSKMDCVLVSWGFRDKAIFEKYTPVAVFDDPSELTQLA